MWEHERKLKQAAQHFEQLQAQIRGWEEGLGYTLHVSSPTPILRTTSFALKSFVPLRTSPFLWCSETSYKTRARRSTISLALLETSEPVGG